MQPMMHTKREVSSYIAYRFRGGALEFYLQKRDSAAPTHAGLFGLFGGGLEEGESPEVCLMREVKEELAYTPKAAKYFSRYETAVRVFYIYIERVNEEFEAETEVHEGEYGRFLTLQELIDHHEVGVTTLFIIQELHDALASSI